MSIADFFTFGFALFVLAIKPGPNLFAFTARTLTDGFVPAVFFALGITTAQMIFATLAMLSFTIPEESRVFVHILFQTIGAAVFIWMGVKGLMEHLEMREGAPLKRNSGFGENYWTGLVITLGNPLAIFFFAALFPTFMNIGALGWADIPLGLLAVFIFDFGTMVAIAALIVTAGNVLRHGNVLNHLRLFTSVVLILIGIAIGLSAMPGFKFADFYF